MTGSPEKDSVTPKFLTTDQVARLLRVPKSFVYRRTAQGHDDPIPHYRLGGHLRFQVEEIEAWIEKHKRNTGAPTPTLNPPQQASRTATRERLTRREPPSDPDKELYGVG